ncbi:MAG: hypothetical protein AABZ39_12170 [Spirochaetota bacterium]
MSIEHKICAEIYHRIYDMIDHATPEFVEFCLDNPSRYQEDAIPDFVMPLKSAVKILKIEVKILNGDDYFVITEKQYSSWKKRTAADLKWIIYLSHDKYIYLDNMLIAMMEEPFQYSNKKYRKIVLPRHAITKVLALKDIVEKIRELAGGAEKMRTFPRSPFPCKPEMKRR